MKKGYVIFKYEDGNFVIPEFFTDKDEAYKRFDELSEKLKEDLDGEVDEWHEIDGKEISLMCQDTIYRIGSVDYNDDCKKLYLYCDMENDKYFQIGHYMDTESESEALGMLSVQYATYQDYATSDCDDNFKHSLHSNYNDTLQTASYWTENGSCGDACFGCMFYPLILKEDENTDNEEVKSKSTYDEIYNLLIENDGFLGLSNIWKPTIRYDGREKVLNVCAVVYKFSYFDDDTPILNIVLVENGKDGGCCWDMDDFLDEENMKELLETIKKEY